MNTIELLSPVGDFECLKAAVQNGANSVYLGAADFNARYSAKNFSIEELEKAILKLKNEGKAIIFSSHIMNHVENLCDEILLINNGEALLQGNLNEILKTYSINGSPANSLNDIFIDKVGELSE